MFLRSLFLSMLLTSCCFAKTLPPGLIFCPSYANCSQGSCQLPDGGLPYQQIPNPKAQGFYFSSGTIIRFGQLTCEYGYGVVNFVVKNKIIMPYFGSEEAMDGGWRDTSAPEYDCPYQSQNNTLCAFSGI